MSDADERTSRVIRGWLLPLFVTVAGLVVSVAISIGVAQRERAEEALATEQRVERFGQSLQARVQSYMDTLPGLRLAASGATGLSDDEFRRYLDGISLQSRFPGLAVTFTARLVDHADRPAFEAMVRADRSRTPEGHPGFTITPPGERPRYLALRHLHPPSPRSFGYDLFDPASAYREAAERAIDSGRYTTTAPLLLAANRDSPRRADALAIVVRLGVYRDGLLPPTLEERRRLANGVVGVSFRIRDLVLDVAPPELLRAGRLHIVDPAAVTVAGAAGVAFDSQAGPADVLALRPDVPQSGVVHTIEVGDRQWRIVYEPQAAASPWSGGSGEALSTLVAGAAIAMLIGALLRALTRTNDIAAQRVEERTRELQAEKRELAHSERRFRLLYEAVFDAVLRTRPDGSIEGANPAACRLFGLDEARLCQLGRADLVDIADPRLQPLLDQRERDGFASGQIRMRRGDGTPFEAEVSSSRYVDDDGRVAMTIVVRDVDDRVRAERERLRLQEQLWHSQKMTAIGTLAGGIAHDFNNVLAGILANADILLGDTDDPAHRERLALIRRAAQRARDLVRQILTFSRPDVGDDRPVDIRPLVGEAIDLLRATIPPGVALELTLPDQPAWCSVDPTQLQQIVVNLCTNSWHAMPSGSGRIAVGVTLPSPGRLRLRVRDDGVGMDADTRARIFEPFFTTKPVGQGTGLGLAVVHGIVAARGGELRVDSTPGAGTTIDVWLPCVEAGAEHAATAAAEPRLADLAAGRRLFYLDDDPVLQLSVGAWLQRAGFRVESFGEAGAMLDALRADPAGVAVLVTDQTMPGMTGLEAIVHARGIAPALRTVLVSGLMGPELEAQALAAGADAVVPKEHLTERLGAALARVLDSPTPADAPI